MDGRYAAHQIVEVCVYEARIIEHLLQSFLIRVHAYGFD